jgi:acetyl esterase/lipase
MRSLQTIDVMRLWPGRAPGAIGDGDPDVPTLTAFRPRRPTHSAMIVCPGGGYDHLAAHEGEPVARWLNTLGISAFVLKYRHAPRYRHPSPLLDATRAIRTVRARADECGIDPARIGVLGFSAGGHLASTLSTHFDLGDPLSTDPIERASSRPDKSVLLYPVITLTALSAHTGSRRNLLPPDASDEQLRALSNELHVDSQTPPAFLFHTADDPSVPVENALLYASALRSANVPFELHVYEHGRHGVGLASDDPVLCTWTDRCAAWLTRHGF